MSMVREFSRKVVAVSAAERDKTKEFPKNNFKQMGELGLMGMMVPLEYGGEGLILLVMFWLFQKLPILCFNICCYVCSKFHCL